MHNPDEDITLDPDWIDSQTQRLISWEILVRYLTLNTQEIPAEKLCDMIGVPKNYVYGILKKAKKKAEHAKRSI